MASCGIARRLPGSVHHFPATFETLCQGGARIVGLPSSARLLGPQLPAALARLTEMRQLSLTIGSGWGSGGGSVQQLEGGWEHLRSLEALDMRNCSTLRHLPAAVAGLTRLTRLSLEAEWIVGGWQHLPQSLEQLLIESCDLEQLPAALAGLPQLTQLSLAGNEIAGG